MNKPIENATEEVNGTKKVINALKSERNNTLLEIAAIQASIRAGRASRAGFVFDVLYLKREIRRLGEKLEKIEGKIAREKEELTNQENKLERLKHEQKDHEINAKELSRRYNKCIEKTKNTRK